MTPDQRRQLRADLLEIAPWLTHPEHGPQAVDAGSCARCEQAPRLLPTCGPAGHEALCRRCALELGDDGWCDGHHEEGLAARAWAEQLPPRWGDLVVLWWVATGELRPTAAAGISADELPAWVTAALPPPAEPPR